MRNPILNTIRYSLGLVILVPFTVLLILYGLYYLTINDIGEWKEATDSIKDLWRPIKL